MPKSTEVTACWEGYPLQNHPYSSVDIFWPTLSSTETMCYHRHCQFSSVPDVAEHPCTNVQHPPTRILKGLPSDPLEEEEDWLGQSHCEHVDNGRAMVSQKNRTQ